MTRFVRFEAAMPNARGVHPGVFALANGLGRSGQLSAKDERWWLAENARLEEAYPVPAAAIFDRGVNPVTSSWFRVEAIGLIASAQAYVKLVERYGLAVRESRSSAPGRVLYADAVQVVVAPCG